MRKLSSRKLWITIANTTIAISLKLADKLKDEFFTIILLASTILYILMEGLIDIRRIKLSRDELRIEMNKPQSKEGSLDPPDNKKPVRERS